MKSETLILMPVGSRRSEAGAPEAGVSTLMHIAGWKPALRRLALRPIMIAPHLLQGRKGERVACRFLLRQGFDVLARRYRGHSGELDIVAFEHETLVFVEVKARSSRHFGEPWEFVDWQKQQKLLRTAEEFIAHNDLGQYPYRFDIVSVLGEDATLFRNAF